MNNQLEEYPTSGSIPTTRGTKLRLFLQVLVYINQIVMLFSEFQFADNIVYQILSLVLTIGITGMSYWFNNDWTGMAKLVGKVLDIFKDGKITQEEIDELIREHSTE